MVQPLLIALISVLFLAALVDHLLQERSIQNWRAATLKARRSLNELEFAAAARRSNEWFLELFDAIYGRGFFSLRRFVRSLIATTLFVILLAYPLGFFDLISYHERLLLGEVTFNPLSSLAKTLLVLFVVNLLADYVSLQETRIVMRFSYGGGLLRISFLFLFDLLVTFSIFVVIAMIFDRLVFGVPSSLIPHFFDIWALFLAVIKDVFTGDILSIVREVDFGKQNKEIGEEFDLRIFVNIYRPFIFSTFMTSILWFLFVGSALSIKSISRLSPFLSLFLLTLSRSPKPARAAAGILTVPLLVALIVAFLVERTT